MRRVMVRAGFMLVLALALTALALPAVAEEPEEEEGDEEGKEAAAGDEEIADPNV